MANVHDRAGVSGTSRREVIVKAAALTGMAGILAIGRAPAFAQTAAKKLVFAHLNPKPESAAVAFDWFAQEVTKRTNGALDVQFFGSTLLNKELEIMNAVKAGSIAIGDPAGAVATIFPEMAVFLTPYLVKNYDQAYRMFNGTVGDQLDKTFQQKYGLKTLCFWDYGFRHFFNNKRPIATPRDLRGLKLRVQQSKVFADTVNGLGANAVPMPFSEVIPATQQGVIDGADLPVINIDVLKVYEVAKYTSMTFHNYGPCLTVMNLGVWNSLTPDQQKIVLEASRAAQEQIRKSTESVDNFASAKGLLEPKGMKVNEADLDAFRKLAEQRVWPAFKSQFGDLWDVIEKA